MNKWMLVGLFSLFGTLGILYGLRLARQTRKLLARGRRCPGRYVAVEAQGSPVSRKRYSQQAVVEFPAADGRPVRFLARVATPWEGRKIGRPVGVVYDPDDPSSALVDSFVELWMPVIIVLGTALGIAAGAVLAALFAPSTLGAG